MSRAIKKHRLVEKATVGFDGGAVVYVADSDEDTRQNCQDGQGFVNGRPH